MATTKEDVVALLSANAQTAQRKTPVVTGLSPKEGIPGTQITIRGENLGINPNDLIGTFSMRFFGWLHWQFDETLCNKRININLLRRSVHLWHGLFDDVALGVAAQDHRASRSSQG